MCISVYNVCIIYIEKGDRVMKKRINITIDDKTLYIVNSLAEERGIDRSTMITLCIRVFDMDHDCYCDDYDSGRD